MLATRTLALTLIAALSLLACKSKPADEAPPAPADGNVPFSKLDFSTLPKDFPAAIKAVRASQSWSPRDKAIKGDANADPRTTMDLKMNAELLGQTRELGCAFLDNWQLPEGNFRYMYDWLDKTWVQDDHQVRQAGSLWGVGTCYRYAPTESARAVLDKGLAFWFTNTIPGPVEGSLNLRYPGDPWMHSGTVALVALAIIEYLKADAPMDEAYRAELNTKLDGYLAFLSWMQLPNGHISDRFDHRSNKRRSQSSPYYDGESLLAMTKAARQLDRTALVPTIEKAARSMAETYTVKSWAKDRDSNQTKGFFQWGSMSFAEYYLAGWKDKELFGDVAQSLGWWMIHTHKTLTRQRNHAYAMEGLIANWRIANLRGDVPAQTDLLYTLDRSMHKLFQWQIGGPLASQNTWLKDQGKDDPMAVGGIMNARKPSKADVKKDVSHQLRIDVTQHQMHATTMALEHVYVPVK
jgi:hypothetical protein